MRPFPTQRWITFLENADDLFQVAVALVLFITALLVFFNLFHTLIVDLAQGAPVLVVAFHLIHDALLVLIILELVWTAISYLKSHTLPLEPFLIVATIASVRRLLFLGVQAVEQEAGQALSRSLLTEIGLHTLMVLVFAVSLAIVRWSRRYLSGPSRSPRTPGSS